ncbi:DNA-binding MarR family transcriptional regulator [Saccharopolyspora lacisalsi]|uniref:DNA-binding MarR family transcriptional regulator n=1 Tax=Halosaccharopolyspora lacisalsi TaxID=1000566 RepID=A0A839E6Z0_9PSEU|nr:MarR family transcriptional regulator [Halosaccharopolyspora lacisalsi]MBA8827467.1 DNA-binding MarR family transcriptional regulator [Halosaccharopolyspora lacisalsi]
MGDDDTRWLNNREMSAWRSYIVGSALLEYRLSRELQTEHGVSLADYEILVQLSEQPRHRQRMSELAQGVAHSKSRISHQIRRLEAKGLVLRRECPSDGRVVLALLTDEGKRLLRQAAPTHVAGVREHMVDFLDEEECRVLNCVFGRITEHLRD